MADDLQNLAYKGPWPAKDLYDLSSFKTNQEKTEFDQWYDLQLHSEFDFKLEAIKYGLRRSAKYFNMHILQVLHRGCPNFEKSNVRIPGNCAQGVTNLSNISRSYITQYVFFNIQGALHAKVHASQSTQTRIHESRV